jgi:hypothetical protein
MRLANWYAFDTQKSDQGPMLLLFLQKNLAKKIAVFDSKKMQFCRKGDPNIGS